jgi:hypothetical protein
MYKLPKSTSTTGKSTNKGTPLVVLLASAGGAFLAYLIGFLTFVQQHPIHWGLAILGGVGGWFVGKLIYRLRGETDII